MPVGSAEAGAANRERAGETGKEDSSCQGALTLPPSRAGQPTPGEGAYSPRKSWPMICWSHRLLADVAAPFAAVGAQRAAAAVDVLGRVHGRLDGALEVVDLGLEGARDRAVVLDARLTTSHVGSVPTRNRVPAGIDRSTSSSVSRPPASAAPGARIASATAPIDDPAAAARRAAAQVVRGGALEGVADGAQAVGHRAPLLAQGGAGRGERGRARRPGWCRASRRSRRSSSSSTTRRRTRLRARRRRRGPSSQASCGETLPASTCMPEPLAGARLERARGGPRRAARCGRSRTATARPSRRTRRGSARATSQACANVSAVSSCAASSSRLRRRW